MENNHKFLLDSDVAKANSKNYEVHATNETIKDIVDEYLNKYGNDANLNNIDVSHVTDMSMVFYNKDFIGDVSEWDVSNVEIFRSMFQGCKNFNSDISKWDVHNGESFDSMFAWCRSFNSDISTWDVSSGKYFSGMFLNCHALDQNFSKWNMKNAETTSDMFCKCFDFTGKGLDKWKLPKVKDISFMFYYCRSLDVDLSGWSISNKVTRTSYYDECPCLQKSFDKRPEIHVD